MQNFARFATFREEREEGCQCQREREHAAKKATKSVALKGAEKKPEQIARKLFYFFFFFWQRAKAASNLKEM